MALFFECTLQCARKLLDTADIVRDAMLRQLTGYKERETPKRRLERQKQNFGAHSQLKVLVSKSKLTRRAPSAVSDR